MSTPASESTTARSDMHQIGEVAERVSLSLRTVRYYEEMGLITPEQRTDGGFRLYTEENIDRLLLIKQMKPLGFTLVEMRELIEARDALRTLEPHDPRREQPAEVLAKYVESAGIRSQELSEQLATAVKLVRQLSRESRR
jgi:DNA-binding transcriptional MerR regulator